MSGVAGDGDATCRTRKVAASLPHTASSRASTRRLFEDIADPADWEIVAAIEARTNPRVGQDVGDISLVPVERRISGAGASWVMAAFTHVSPHRPSRFSDGTYGVYYAGDRFEVALLETVYHFGRFLAATDEPGPLEEDFRLLVGEIDSRMHDIRNDRRFSDCRDPDSYAASEALARRLPDNEQSNGIVYESVRYPAGAAVAAFWPDVVGPPVQAEHHCYRWTGSQVSGYFFYGEEAWRTLPQT